MAIAPDYQEVLAWRGVPARRVVVDTAVAGVHALNEAIAQNGPLLWMTLPQMLVYVVLQSIGVSTV